MKLTVLGYHGGHQMQVTLTSTHIMKVRVTIICIDGV